MILGHAPTLQSTIHCLFWWTCFRLRGIVLSKKQKQRLSKKLSRCVFFLFGDSQFSAGAECGSGLFLQQRRTESGQVRTRFCSTGSEPTLIYTTRRQLVDFYRPQTKQAIQLAQTQPISREGNQSADQNRVRSNSSSVLSKCFQCISV